jgi:hypothetical protein
MMHMDHKHGEPDPCSRPGESVFNEPHYHAFVVLGKKRLFASHLTQLFCEVHMYHLIIELSLPERSWEAFIKERAAHPGDTYFLANTLPDSKVGNSCDDPMTLSEVAARLRTSFVGNIFRGIPYQEKYEDWPWKGVRPFLSNISVSVERIVHFKPFSATMNYPSTLTYLLFGRENEAHMVHYQTRMPDYDHMASLRVAPSWLANDMLAAGVMVDLPDVPRLGASEQATGVRCTNPFKDGATVQVRYRSAGPHRPVTVGHSYWFCTRVCNNPDPCTQYKPCGSPTPGEYLLS